MPNSVLSWQNRPDRQAAAVRLLREVDSAGGLLQGGQSPPDGRYGGGLHVSLCAATLAAERDVPVASILAGRDQVSWLDQSERIWGIERVLGGMLDSCFERVPAHEAGSYSVAAMSAIPVGRDLSPVAAHWMLELLTDQGNGLCRYTPPGSLQYTAVTDVAELFRRTLAGDEPTAEQWLAAAKSAAEAGELANAADPAGPRAYTAAAATLAAAGYAPDLVPAQVRVAAMRASAGLEAADAVAYRAAYLRTEAFARAAEYACEAVRAGADARFQAVLGVDGTAAVRARTAEAQRRPVAPVDAAAMAHVRAAADSAVAECVAYYRWRAARLLALLAE
jgi:hypothetical protein